MDRKLLIGAMNLASVCADIKIKKPANAGFLIANNKTGVIIAKVMIIDFVSFAHILHHARMGVCF